MSDQQQQQKTMTRAELAEFVSGQIRNFVGTELANLVKSNIETAIAPLREQATNRGSMLLGGGGPEPQKREGGIAMARMVRATAAAKMQQLGPEAAIQILKNWGDHDLADAWAGARQKSMTSGDALAGGFLVPEQYSQDLINVLRSATVVRRLGAPTLPLPTGSIKLPKITAGSVAQYVGESTNAPKTQLATGQLGLTFKKLMALVPVSNDLLRYSSPGADAIVRNDLVAAFAVKEDATFIRGVGTDASPKGMRYFAPAANVLAANSSISNANTATDLGRLMQQLMGNDIPMIKPVWIFNPRIRNYLITLQNTNGAFVYKDEMAQGTLWGYPFGVTTGVPVNLTDGGGTSESEIYFVDIAQAIIGEAQNIMVDASGEAAYSDGSTVQSAWSRDETSVRAIAEHDFGMRYDNAIAILNQVNWAPGS
jgi:HK97 family phage major capsid protein